MIIDYWVSLSGFGLCNKKSTVLPVICDGVFHSTAQFSAAERLLLSKLDCDVCDLLGVDESGTSVLLGKPAFIKILLHVIY